MMKEKKSFTLEGNKGPAPLGLDKRTRGRRHDPAAGPITLVTTELEKE